MSFHSSGKPVCHGLTSYTLYCISQGPMTVLHCAFSNMLWVADLSIAGILLIEHLGSTLHFAGCSTFFQDGGRLRITFCACYCVTKFLDQPRCSLTESTIGIAVSDDKTCWNYQALALAFDVVPGGICLVATHQLWWENARQQAMTCDQRPHVSHPYRTCNTIIAKMLFEYFWAPWKRFETWN